MSFRPRGYGLSAEVKNKILSKYDVEKEQEVRQWMEAVIGEPLVNVSQSNVGISFCGREKNICDDPGFEITFQGADPTTPLGPQKFQQALKNGVYLCKLAQKVIGTKIKINQGKLAFHQMENINNFLVNCEKYGVSNTDLFQTVDLYENQNMWQVILTIIALGRKAQSHGFDGPVLGPREAQKNLREFTEEQLRAGDTMIGLQAGTNKLASQKGMSFGGTRHIADIKVEEGVKDGHGIIGLQMGTNKVASQSGMSFGSRRHVADIKVHEGSRDGQNIIGLQMGSNQGASQKGMSMGNTRHIADIKVDAPSKDGEAIIGLQMGSNQGANQSGINMGKPRGIAD